MDADPSGSQSSGQIAAERRREPLHYHEPDYRRHPEGCRPRWRPRRKGSKTQPGAKGYQNECDAGRRDSPTNDRRPTDRRRRTLLDHRNFIGDHASLRSVPEQQDKKNDRKGNTQQPEKNAATHRTLLAKDSGMEPRKRPTVAGICSEALNDPAPDHNHGGHGHGGGRKPAHKA